MDIIKELSLLLAVLASLWGLYRGIHEYRLQGTQRRAEIFMKKQAEFFSNPKFNEIRTLVETDAERLTDIAFDDKRAYLCFFEEIALLTQSGLLMPPVSAYMFGYYAVRCQQSRHFWFNINPDPRFWAVFLGFAERMQQQLQAQAPDPLRLRF